MTLAEAYSLIKRLALKFKVIRLTEIKFTAIGLALLAFAIVRLIVPSAEASIAVGLLTFISILIARILRTGVLRWNPMHVALFLNRSFPSLKDSADLLVSDKPLTSLEEVQRQYALSELGLLRGRITVPHRLAQGLGILAVGATSVLLLPAAVLVPHQHHEAMNEPAPETAKPASPELLSVVIGITPPSYTRVKPHTTDNPNISAPANSQVKWSITFRGEAVNPAIIFSGQDLVPLEKDDKGYKAFRRMQQRAFYQISWDDLQGKHYTTDFFQADLREDLPPVVEIIGRDQFQEVKPGDPWQMEVRARISDDYSVADAHLIATVSKGSGESVKFREEKLLFENASRMPGRQVELSRQIDLQKLGLEPGDELYFYAEAIDNRAPLPNHSRTETFFIALQDTARAATVADTGLGVDLMPEYFRSQRQIIIDTEKLLAEERKIKKQEFNSRSNELGFDQKTLRLRYGQFLGEEDEAGIGVEAVLPVREALGQAQAEAEDEENDPLKKFGHQHDTKNEHNLVDEKKGVKIELDHDHEAEQEEGKEVDLMKPFLHQHDSEEEATFFVQSVKTKLKAALTMMWESELQLRIYEPRKSLPVQYKILNLLKEIAQDSRVYVHRTGFDPPPIKEERRLTGELNEVASTTERTQSLAEEQYPAIQAALEHTETLLQHPDLEFTTSTSLLATNAGYEVASEEIEHPGQYLQTLSDLRAVAERKVPTSKRKATLLRIRKSFWSILPVETYSPTRGQRTLHPLDKAMLDQLERAHE